MSESSHQQIEQVIRNPLFPEVDMALRRGRHIDRDDLDHYVYLVESQLLLEEFYNRYNSDLIHVEDGYFYLLPRGTELGQRHLTAGEMLVGQALALIYLDPATVKSGGITNRDAVLSRLVGLLGEQVLVQALNPRRKKINEHVAQAAVRAEILKAFRGLAALGFLDVLDDDRIRTRSPVLRFTDHVRGLSNPAEMLERLITEGKAAEYPSDDDSEGSEDTGA